MSVMTGSTPKGQVIADDWIWIAISVVDQAMNYFPLATCKATIDELLEAGMK